MGGNQEQSYLELYTKSPYTQTVFIDQAIKRPSVMVKIFILSPGIQARLALWITALWVSQYCLKPVCPKLFKK